VVDQGRTVASVAEGLGVNAGVLSRWRHELAAAGTAAFPGNGNPSPADEEIRRLKKELSTARQERDILKKAMVYFANDKN